MVKGPYGVTKDCGVEREYPDYLGAPYVNAITGSLRERARSKVREGDGRTEPRAEVLSFEHGGMGYVPRNSRDL